MEVSDRTKICYFIWRVVVLDRDHLTILVDNTAIFWLWVYSVKMKCFKPKQSYVSILLLYPINAKESDTSLIQRGRCNIEDVHSIPALINSKVSVGNVSQKYCSCVRVSAGILVHSRTRSPHTTDAFLGLTLSFHLSYLY